MTYCRSLLKAAMVAAPLSALGFSAQAADVVSTIQNQPQFSTLAKAIEAAGIAKPLQGSGPYTIFAPTDQAFAQLPPGTMDYLMKQGNQDQLKKLLQYHVVKGKEFEADQMIGKQAKVDTVEGGKLSLDGMGRMVLLVPTGLTVTRVGDQVVVRRELAAMSAPAVEVAPGGGGQQAQSSRSSASQQQASSGSNDQQQAQTDVTQQSNMPATKHQEEVLKQHPKVEQQQTMAQTEGAMPSTKHQREVLRGQQLGEQGGQQQASSSSDQQQSGSSASSSDQQQASGGGGNESYQRQASSTDENGNQQAQTDVTQQSNMPATKHQEEVLKQHPKVEQQQTMAQTEGAMPSTKHQREVLRGQQPGEQQNGQQASSQQGGQETGNGQQMVARESGGNQGALRQATVIGGPIKADNGVIYAIDGVLVPQSILSEVESQAQEGQGHQNNQQDQTQQNKG
jgi:uncharacterized surface protein with fasciclin (FAS1) repeats